MGLASWEKLSNIVALCEMWFTDAVSEHSLVASVVEVRALHLDKASTNKPRQFVVREGVDIGLGTPVGHLTRLCHDPAEGEPRFGQLLAKRLDGALEAHVDEKQLFRVHEAVELADGRLSLGLAGINYDLRRLDVGSPLLGRHRIPLYSGIGWDLLLLLGFRVTDQEHFVLDLFGWLVRGFAHLSVCLLLSGSKDGFRGI